MHRFLRFRQRRPRATAWARRLTAVSGTVTPRGGRCDGGDTNVALTQYYTASSLDGFIADPDNSLEWLFSRARDDAGVLSYGRFIAEVGALGMGATTYEWLLEHEVYKADPDGVWPYEIPCWVFTTGAADRRRLAGRAHSDAVGSVHERLVEAAGGRNVWLVGGGDLVGQFADSGLLDEILVTFAPVTLGAGAPLLPRRLELRLEETGRNGDFVGARYSVVRDRAAHALLRVPLTVEDREDELALPLALDPLVFDEVRLAPQAELFEHAGRRGVPRLQPADLPGERLPHLVLGLRVPVEITGHLRARPHCVEGFEVGSGVGSEPQALRPHRLGELVGRHHRRG